MGFWVVLWVVLLVLFVLILVGPHGMGIIKINGEERLAVLGGTQGYGRVHDSIELYNIKTLKWELAEDLEMDIQRFCFGFVSI